MERGTVSTPREGSEKPLGWEVVASKSKKKLVLRVPPEGGVCQKDEV